MARHACPGCARKLNVPRHIIRAVIKCPSCSLVFSVVNEAPSPPTPPRPPTVAPAADQAVPPPPLLTSAHQCQHCGSPLTSPVGRPAATVVCPSCDNKASVYAVLHTCPSCRRLLESPSRSAGTETTCPACTHSLRVPSDVVLKGPPAYSDEYRFGFACQSCSREVVSRRPDVGTYAVCPHCRVPLVVPQSGHYLETAPPAARDPLSSLHASKGVACPRCRTRIPARASACPLCGAKSTSPWGW
jgi:DNA-directed RNA polymerase subunit RPC12/RpoP